MKSIAEIFDNSKELLDSISNFVDKYIGTSLLRRCNITKIVDSVSENTACEYADHPLTRLIGKVQESIFLEKCVSARQILTDKILAGFASASPYRMFETGSFFRDYVYIPMGGNRRHQVVNLAVVWFLTGLWHGASWNYIFWGLFWGFLVAIEKLFLRKVLDKLPSLFGRIYLLAAAAAGWTMFYFEDLGKLKQCFLGMFGKSGIPLSDEITMSLLKGSCFVIIAAAVFSCPVCRILSEKTEALASKSVFAYTWAKIAENIVLVGILAVSSILLVKQSYNPFLYFRS